MDLTRSSSPFRGRTPERTVPYHSPSGSRASSACSVRSMIDERLEWAHQERVRSASRDHSPQPSPFHESSPFHAEFARGSDRAHRFGHAYVCDCCPIKSKEFDTVEGLESHVAEKQYSCAYCQSRFKDQDSAERHMNVLHMRRSFWSCAALSNPKDAVCMSSNGGKRCSYCGVFLSSYVPDIALSEHMVNLHKFGQCNKSKKFFRADHFYQHLKHSHGASSWSGITDLEEFCETVTYLDDPPPSVEDLLNPISSSNTAQVPGSPASRKRRLSSSSAERYRFHSGAQGGSRLLKPKATLKRSFTMEACTECRRRKSICDGLAPFCGGCIQSGRLASCVYEDGRRYTLDGLLPKPSIERSPTPQEIAIAVLSATEASTPFDPPPLPVPLVESDKSRSELVCSTCQRSFTRRTILMNHQRTHTGEKPFSCKVSGCEHKFAQQSDKTRHEQAQHAEKTFKCGVSSSGGLSWGCGRTFRRKDGLLEHHHKIVKGRKCLEQRNRVEGSDGIDVEDSLTL